MHRSRWAGAVCLACGLASYAAAQQQVDAHHLHERILLVLPMTGAGTYADPRRPLLLPTAQEMSAAGEIVSWSVEPSDDGRFAIVEIAARSRAGLQRFMADARALRVFLKGRDRKVDIERELKLYKATFKVGGAVQGARLP